MTFMALPTGGESWHVDNVQKKVYVFFGDIPHYIGIRMADDPPNEITETFSRYAAAIVDYLPKEVPRRLLQ